MLVEGRWSENWQPIQAKDAKGGFVRQASSFRNWVTPDGSPGSTGEGGFAAEAGRYHLYVALTCPWASRTLIARKLKGLEAAIDVSVVEPAMTPQGWRFGDYPGAGRDPSMARPISMKSTPRPILTSPDAPPFRCCGTSASRRSSTMNRPTSCECSTPASARSQKAR
jgi:glutathionyl-hydroquinone reductase